MDRQTLVNYGWIVIASLVLAVMLTLATPFGKYVMDGVSSVASGYINASNNAMSEENKGELVTEWENKWANSVTKPEQFTHTKVAQGAVYFGIDGTEYNEGETIPEPQKGDIYAYDDYQYCYGYEYLTSENAWSNQAGYPIECDSWSVRYVGDSSEPGEILESIGTKYITNMCETFYNTNIEIAPKIPSHVTNIVAAFSYTNISTAPIVPSSVTDMSYAFEYCYNLSGDVQINTTPTKFTGCFNCTGVESISGSCSDSVKLQLLNTVK